MSDNFIPLNQSTPVKSSPKWQQGINQNQRNYHNNRFQNVNSPSRSGFNNRWGNNSRNNSFMFRFKDSMLTSEGKHADKTLMACDRNAVCKCPENGDHLPYCSNWSENNSSYRQENKHSIDDYLHPSMLQDPWAQLRQKNNQ